MNPVDLERISGEVALVKHWFKAAFFRFPLWLAKVPPDASGEAARIHAVERDLGLPVRGAVVVLLAYSLFFTRWYEEMGLFQEGVLEVVKLFFLLYLIISLAAGILVAGMDEVPLAWIRDAVLVSCLVDALFLGALTVLTGGFESMLFWGFMVLIIRNAAVLCQATRQLVVNLLTTLLYLGSGLTEILAKQVEIEILDPLSLAAFYPEGPEVQTAPALLMLFLLILVSFCGYGIEVLFERQETVREEAHEFSQRQRQLESAGRLAAEIAHQLKNPLGIINNAAFTLQRTVKEGKTITQQIKIIREEVDRADRIITELMGYARLVEGRVERLDAAQEIDSALERVFPPAVQFDIKIYRDYAPALPPLLMQRSHLSEVLVNILQNAREATNGRGHVGVSARNGEGYSVLIAIEDDGPGIAPQHLERIFEPYFSTKHKGSGLGLAIVKHNAELYGGTVRVESELGKGTRFTLHFPAKTVMQLRR